MHDSYTSDMLSDMSREELELLAKQACKASDVYDLADKIDQTSDQELMNIIINNMPEGGDIDIDGDMELLDEPEDRNDDSAKYEVILDDDLPDFSGASHDNNGNEYPDTDR